MGRITPKGLHESDRKLGCLRQGPHLASPIHLTKGLPPPRPKDIERLIHDPSLAPHFDEKYGKGSAKAILGGQAPAIPDAERERRRKEEVQQRPILSHTACSPQELYVLRSMQGVVHRQ